MEYLDLYDENKNLTGEKVLRSRTMKIESGKYICMVVVFIENSKNEFLIQMTSKEKGNIWATTGGLVKSGSTCDQTILEEIKEELGFSVSIDEIKRVYTKRFDYAFQDVYYLKKDIDSNNLKLQKEEVDFVKWLSIDEIYKLIEQNKFRKGNIEAFEKVLNFRRQ